MNTLALTTFVGDVLTAVKNTGVAEWIAIITALLYILLATKANKWCWFFGIISSAIYVWFFFDLHYYYDSFLNIYYVIIGFYGWYQWSRHEPTDNTGIQIHFAGLRTILLLISLGLLSTLLLGWGGPRFASWLCTMFDHSFEPFKRPYLDAMLTSFSLIATWMTTRKMIENWIFWIVIDAIYVGVCFISDRPSTALLMLLYSIIAIFGFYKWKREIR